MKLSVFSLVSAGWSMVDFAVDVSEVYAPKLAVLEAYESVFSGALATLFEHYGTEDRYVGSLVDVRDAEAFKARSSLVVEDPKIFGKVRFGVPDLLSPASLLQPFRSC